MAQAKGKAGRKGRYQEWLKPDRLLLLTSWRRNGLSDAQIIENMGIASTTFYQWQRRYPAFKEALDDGRELAVAQVENAAFKAALGYTYEETKTVKTFDMEGNEITERLETVTKHSPPNPSMAIFILRNKSKEHWSNKPETAETIALRNEKVRLELDILEAQKERLSGGGTTPFDELLADMLTYKVGEDEGQDEPPEDSEKGKD